MKAKNCLIFGGSGQIGRHLIRKLTKNNYRVTVVTRNIHQKGHIIKTQGNAGYINIVEANIFEETKIRKLFENADTISIHCPHTDETRGAVNKGLLGRMKPKGIVINTARGPIINLDDLFEALKSNSTTGAALDVLPIEPADKSHPLLKAYMNDEEWLRGRLMVTPHAAFYSPPGLHDLRSKAVATVAQRLRDGSTRNCQNLEFLTK